MKNLIAEFKKFIMRGNVVDLAVGVVMGNAFSKIVTSLVNDIMMPIIGIIIGGHDFKNLSITIGNAKIMYGSFIQNIIDFLIIAFSIFVVLRIINKAHEKFEAISKKEAQEKAEKEEEQSDTELSVLLEIRELLSKNASEKKD